MAFTFASAAQQEDYEERAALMEYLGNLPREMAERLALACVLKAQKKQPDFEFEDE